MENQGMQRQDENENKNKDQRRKAQEDKRKGSNQEMIIEGMIRRFKHMLNSSHFDGDFKNKLLSDMQTAINEEKGIIGE